MQLLFDVLPIKCAIQYFMLVSIDYFVYFCMTFFKIKIKRFTFSIGKEFLFRGVCLTYLVDENSISPPQ